MKILDTNFICSLFRPEDANHTKAVDQFFALPEEEKIIIPFIVASELIINRDGCNLLYVSKQLTPKFQINNEADLDFIINLPDKVRTKLRANDCLILALCDRLNANLLTFDKKLSKLASVKSR